MLVDTASVGDGAPDVGADEASVIIVDDSDVEEGNEEVEVAADMLAGGRQ